ncbi:radical SAM methylthiotransferase, MiaB/RimO family [Desulfonatronum thiosulfatophilum]|uniref:Radical SAM methylthiotransferase, MiaB/RimO family n=1 Tax=Desulfonatronum thiosulfatophilum TaxID=617002 RepID=A0A1G6CBZ2_9BACT|nr:MiaB/RimO family radical SAM methylthiotransferase [Desulfonatronum thiosulfatophilum]SDB30292.1 radical SAM methylthiotransferase, MiaB/RimO family [Desulfonatronum thiosulfatophilum]
MQFFLTTFGCKVNQYESQVILERWTGQGHVQVADASQAEVILVHSCAVTGKAVADLRKSVAALHRAAPDAEIVIAGCAAQTFASELTGLGGVSRVVGLKDREQLLRGPLPFPARDSAEDHGSMLAGISRFQRARAQVKVQDGCSHGCTYCIVPLARGAARSREPGAVVEEVGNLLAAGYREVSLIGINLRLYGRGLDERMDFWDLVRTLERTFAPKWAGRARFRLSSLDPAMLGAKAMDVIAGSRMLCPHLHLSLQSASESVLAAMNRGHYRPGPVQEFCRELSAHLGVLALGADLLTGFPGEEDAHFQETLDFCSALPLTYAHVFPFSPRPGTPAAERTDPVPENVRHGRAKVLRGLADQKRRQFWSDLVQREELTMVVEGDDPGQGMCEYYVPCRLESDAPGGAVRELLRVRPLRAGKKALVCLPLRDQDHSG